jgi:hypothetical protein
VVQQEAPNRKEARRAQRLQQQAQEDLFSGLFGN